MYSLTHLYQWTVLVHYDPVPEAGLKGERLYSGVPVELNVLPRFVQQVEQPVNQLVLSHTLQYTTEDHKLVGGLTTL